MASGGEYVILPDAFTTGAVGDRPVACVSAEQQLLDHAGGYDMDETDHEDKRKLRERLEAFPRAKLEAGYAMLAEDRERARVIDATRGEHLPRRFSEG